MQKSSINFLLIILVAAQVLFLGYLVFHSEDKFVGGGTGSIAPFVSASQSTIGIVGVTSSLLVATNTSRTLLEITNTGALGQYPVFCNLKNGAPATTNSGIAIFASSTYRFVIDQNPYTGSLNCISVNGNAIMTILEK